jgi:hypothetical protein
MYATKQNTYMKKEKEITVSFLEKRLIYPEQVIIQIPYELEDIKEFLCLGSYYVPHPLINQYTEDTIMIEIIKCLKYKSRVAEELNILCLNIAKSGLYGDVHHDAAKEYGDIARISLILHATLCQLGLYNGDRLQYVYMKNSQTALWLIREDKHFEYLRNEHKLKEEDERFERLYIKQELNETT